MPDPLEELVVLETPLALLAPLDEEVPIGVGSDCDFEQAHASATMTRAESFMGSCSYHTRRAMFSRRTEHHETENALTVAVRAARGLLDLTVSNPTTAGLPYDLDEIRDALACAAPYAPESLGLRSAREAAAADVGVDPDRVALGASTSEAYAMLFKVLADPGDEILVPVPSYPLFSFLAAYESVVVRTYPVVYAGRWQIDLGALRDAVTPRTKAIVVVSPNNPTGSYLSRGELEAMLDLGLPIISDEVFSTYPLAPHEDHVETVASVERGLVFALSGLSKRAALPQLKLGWMAAGGEPKLVTAAMDRLALVLDAYLSPGTPVQAALPRLLACRSAPDAIRARTRTNLAAMRETFRGTSATVLDVEAGWYAIIRIPETKSDEEWALSLVQEHGVLVHPGYFFDMSRGAHLVISLLTPEADLQLGIRRIREAIA